MTYKAVPVSICDKANFCNFMIFNINFRCTMLQFAVEEGRGGLPYVHWCRRVARRRFRTRAGSRLSIFSKVFLLSSDDGGFKMHGLVSIIIGQCRRWKRDQPLEAILLAAICSVVGGIVDLLNAFIGYIVAGFRFARLFIFYARLTFSGSAAAASRPNEQQ